MIPFASFNLMRVPGILVARTDAESATFLENRSDERDQPFILGATNIELPSYKVGYLAILRKLFELGVEEIRGHLLFAVSEAEYLATFAWLERVGLMSMIAESAQAFKDAMATELDAALDRIDTRYMEIWQAEAGLKTYGLAVADVMESHTDEGERFDMTVEEWLAFSKRASFYEAHERAKSMGIQLIWDCELPKTPEGFYPIQAGIDVELQAGSVEADLLVLGHEHLTALVAALLRSGPLVFDVVARHSDLDEAADQIAHVRVATVAGVGVGNDEGPIVDDRGRLALFFAHPHAPKVLVLVGCEKCPHQPGCFVWHLTEGVARQVRTRILRE